MYITLDLANALLEQRARAVRPRPHQLLRSRRKQR